ncbi:MAG: hypothetical protein ACLVJ6_07130 [Merdibacter sp.]
MIGDERTADISEWCIGYLASLTFSGDSRLVLLELLREAAELRFVPTHLTCMMASPFVTTEPR